MPVIKLKQIKWPPNGLHLWAEILINNHKLFAVVDSGASQTVVDAQMAETLNLKPVKSKHVVSTGVGGPVNNSMAVIYNLQIGSVQLQKVKVVLIDFTTINEAYAAIGKKKVHCILGGDILKRTAAIINYQNSTLKVSLKK
ncbi:MAG: clan AA aspartic protease [Bacteroidia bacterium]|nr:clan AA aspartic protease [Bacteroidia bacterium]